LHDLEEGVKRGNATGSDYLAQELDRLERDIV
jgi:hypothetical protein